MNGNKKEMCIYVPENPGMVHASLAAIAGMAFNIAYEVAFRFVPVDWTGTGMTKDDLVFGLHEADIKTDVGRLRTRLMGSLSAAAMSKLEKILSVLEVVENHPQDYTAFFGGDKLTSKEQEECLKTLTLLGVYYDVRASVMFNDQVMIRRMADIIAGMMRMDTATTVQVDPFRLDAVMTEALHALLSGEGKGASSIKVNSGGMEITKEGERTPFVTNRVTTPDGNIFTPRPQADKASSTFGMVLRHFAKEDKKVLKVFCVYAEYLDYLVRSHPTWAIWSSTTPSADVKERQDMFCLVGIFQALKARGLEDDDLRKRMYEILSGRQKQFAYRKKVAVSADKAEWLQNGRLAVIDNTSGPNSTAELFDRGALAVLWQDGHNMGIQVAPECPFRANDQLLLAVIKNGGESWIQRGDFSLMSGTRRSKDGETKIPHRTLVRKLAELFRIADSEG